jgi:Fe-S-cluster containining protein
MKETVNNAEVLTGESRIHFACHENLPCFTQCCRDVNIYLTPYDVLRLRKALGMGSSDFINRYTHSFLAKITNIPVVQLIMDPQTLTCPFVTPAGCKVYDDRPWACRMYPLDLDPKHPGCYRLIQASEKCLGLKENTEWTVSEWLTSQGVDHYREIEDLYQSVMPPQFSPGSRMDAGLGKLLFLAYDLDVFKEMIQQPSFRKFHEIDEETYRLAMEDEEELLKLAFSYIRSQLEELFSVMR